MRTMVNRHLYQSHALIHPASLTSVNYPPNACFRHFQPRESSCQKSLFICPSVHPSIHSYIHNSFHPSTKQTHKARFKFRAKPKYIFHWLLCSIHSAPGISYSPPQQPHSLSYKTSVKHKKKQGISFPTRRLSTQMNKRKNCRNSSNTQKHKIFR